MTRIGKPLLRKQSPDQKFIAKSLLFGQLAGYYEDLVSNSFKHF